MLKFISVIFLLSMAYCHEDIDYEVEEPEVFLDDECIQQTFATVEDIYTLKSFKLPTTKSGRCLLACMYKKISIITTEGKYSLEGGLVALKRSLNPSSNASEKFSYVVNQCAIEAGDIADDYEGCELAATLFTCIVNNINEFWDSDESESLEV